MGDAEHRLVLADHQPHRAPRRCHRSPMGSNATTRKAAAAAAASAASASRTHGRRWRLGRRVGGESRGCCVVGEAHSRLFARRRCAEEEHSRPSAHSRPSLRLCEIARQRVPAIAAGLRGRSATFWDDCAVASHPKRSPFWTSYLIASIQLKRSSTFEKSAMEEAHRLSHRIAYDVCLLPPGAPVFALYFAHRLSHLACL